MFFGMKRGGVSDAPPGKPRKKTEMNRFKTMLLAAAVVALPLSAMAQATPATPAQPSTGTQATPATPASPSKGGEHHGHKGDKASKENHKGGKKTGHDKKGGPKPDQSSSLDASPNIQLAAAPFFKPVLGLGLN